MSSLRGISKLAQSIAGLREHIFQHNSSKPSFAMPELISLVLGQLNIIRSELRKKNTLYPAPEMGKTFLNAWLYLFAPQRTRLQDLTGEALTQLSLMLCYFGICAHAALDQGQRTL